MNTAKPLVVSHIRSVNSEQNDNKTRIGAKFTQYFSSLIEEVGQYQKSTL